MQMDDVVHCLSMAETKVVSTEDLETLRNIYVTVIRNSFAFHDAQLYRTSLVSEVQKIDDILKVRGKSPNFMDYIPKESTAILERLKKMDEACCESYQDINSFNVISDNKELINKLLGIYHQTIHSASVTKNLNFLFLSTASRTENFKKIIFLVERSNQTIQGI